MPRRRNVTRKQIRADHWDAHEAVMIRSLRERDNEAIQDELAAMAPGERADMRLALGTTRRLTMLHGIESWSLTDEHGRPLPLNEESLLDLAPEDADYIYNAINDLNQPMSDDEKKVNLSSASNGSGVNPAPYQIA